ncbi:flagellar brake protein [Ectothiorhodospiraceae bacterium WFHF3C12]|nr:flagellar brake protein [Ectothiorhodospiraceae bacterium WFHF3C12]
MAGPEHESEVFVPGLTVQVQVPGYNHRVRASLLAASARRYLALHEGTAGAAEFESLHLRPGDTVVVRFFHEGVAYGFRSSVHMTLREPEPIVFIGYPEQTESLSLRQAPRLYCDLPVQVFGRDEQLPGVALDVSATGCRIAVPDAPAFEIQDEIRVGFALPNRSSVSEVSGVVRRREAQENGQTLGVSADLGEVFEQLESVFRYRPPRR